MKIQNVFLLILTLCLVLITACSFDESGVPHEGADAGTNADAGIVTCSDNLACTDDVVVDGICRHYSTCDVGKACTPNGCEVPAPACTVDGDCPDHAWSCMVADCKSDKTCGFVDTCASGNHCTATGCVPDTPASLEIKCENVDGTRVTFIGDISTGIVTSGDIGDLPGTPGMVSIGWNVNESPGVYWPGTDSGIDTANPSTPVIVSGANWSASSTLALSDAVQQFQFVVANGANTALRYFDLSKWSVTGYCAKGAGGGLLCSCETLPCSCSF